MLGASLILSNLISFSGGAAAATGGDGDNESRPDDIYLEEQVFALAFHPQADLLAAGLIGGGVHVFVSSLCVFAYLVVGFDILSMRMCRHQHSSIIPPPVAQQSSLRMENVRPLL